MGTGMALNLLETGFEVRAWNRSADKLGPVIDEGATACETPAEAARGADVILTILSDAERGLRGDGGARRALQGAADGVFWVQASTIGIAGMERCAGLARRTGAVLYDAPVLGNRSRPRTAIWSSSRPGRRIAATRSGRSSTRSANGRSGSATSRAWARAEGRGQQLDRQRHRGDRRVPGAGRGDGPRSEARPRRGRGGPLDLPYMRTKGAAMIEREFTPSFRLALAPRTRRLSVDAANSVGIELPMLEAIADRMTAAAEEHGDHDMAATFLASAPGA